MPIRRSAWSPGRVTLLGEHTDYNEGCALGIATSSGTSVTAVFDASGAVEVESLSMGRAATSLATPIGPPFIVLAASLARLAGLAGVRASVTSDLPLGAGLSSSAAYAVALALALGLDGEPLVLARACQRAERAAGSDVGLLDQLVALCATEYHVVDLDFHGITTTTFPLPESIGLSLLDTGIRRAVSESAYARRREECASAASIIGPLGRATLADLDQLDDRTARRRVRHVVTECSRVRAARHVLQDGDVVAFGALLNDGHDSLRDDFEVTTDAIDELQRQVRDLPGVTGARLVGAGFGGHLLVAHDPAVDLVVADRPATRVRGGPGASVSSAN